MGPRDATEGTNQSTLHSLVACPRVVPTAGIPLDNSCHPETCSQHSGWPGGVGSCSSARGPRVPKGKMLSGLSALTVQPSGEEPWRWIRFSHNLWLLSLAISMAGEGVRARMPVATRRSQR